MRGPAGRNMFRPGPAHMCAGHPMIRHMRRAGPLVAAAISVLAAAPARAAKPTPIPQLDNPPAKPFKGKPASAHPISGVAAPPQNRFMAKNGLSEIHDDGWQSDFYSWGGPLGRSPHSFSSYLAP